MAADSKSEEGEGDGDAGRQRSQDTQPAADQPTDRQSMPKALDLLRLCMQFNPSKRLSAQEARGYTLPVIRRPPNQTRLISFVWVLECPHLKDCKDRQVGFVP
jgi:serine/threonine protein kinase